jgi:hypothetical protein
MNRKALLREFKQTRRPMGVYRVLNTVSGKALVGSSADLPGILNRHKWQLSLGMHPHRGLQSDWNELGETAFTFEVLDTLKAPDKEAYDPSEDLKTLEALWLEKLAPFGEKGYNCEAKRTT